MVVEQQQGVVLVFDEAANRLERSFVLERAIEDRPAQLVRTVGPHVVFRVQLRKQIALPTG